MKSFKNSNRLLGEHGSTGRNDLPPEMLVQILQHLSLPELCKKKSVRKVWNELISSNVKVADLVVDRTDRIRRFWYSSIRKPFGNLYLKVFHEKLFFNDWKISQFTNLETLRSNGW